MLFWVATFRGKSLRFFAANRADALQHVQRLVAWPLRRVTLSEESI